MQLSDAVYTCHALNNGARETNPLLPKNCMGISLMKAGLTAPIFFIPGDKNKRIYAGVMAASGTFGFVMSIKLTK